MSKTVLTDLRTDAGAHPSSRVSPFNASRALSPLGIVVTRCEVALAAVFLWAAFNKLRPPNGPALFAESIHAFKLGLPDLLLRLATGMTPWIEGLAALCLLLGIASRAAALVLGGLLVLFIALIASVLFRGLNTECGCFGKLSPFCGDKITTCNIWQNLILLGIAVLITAVPRHRLVCASRGA